MIPILHGPNRRLCSIHCLSLIFAMAFVLSACTGAGWIDFQTPSRRGLLTTLQHFETGVRLQNWPLLMESYYLSDHAGEAKKTYGNDLKRWFLADKLIADILGNSSGQPRFFCILALREKHFSPNFEPHFVVYYRIQKTSCREQLDSFFGVIAEGRMEWGFETKQRRWIHLRKLG